MDRAGDGAGQPRYERVCVRLSAHRAGGEFMKDSRGETCFFLRVKSKGRYYGNKNQIFLCSVKVAFNVLPP